MAGGIDKRRDQGQRHLQRCSGLREILRNMANTKEVRNLPMDGYEKEFSKGSVYVSKTVLKKEAILRELLREIQSHRKTHNLKVSQKIILYLDNEMLKEFTEEIKDKVGAKEIKFEHIDAAAGRVQLEEEKVAFRFEVVG